MNNKQVDILLSVYNPNEEYLIKQLISLNNQTYPNLKLYIFDDCIKKRCNLDLFEKYITNFSYEVLPYCEENLNYMGAFEKLVQRSDGEYIAFCDQDDIWMDDKVEKCVAYMNEKNIDLVVTDKQIIDENDNEMIFRFEAKIKNIYNFYDGGSTEEVININVEAEYVYDEKFTILAVGKINEYEYRSEVKKYCVYGKMKK